MNTAKSLAALNMLSVEGITPSNYTFKNEPSQPGRRSLVAIFEEIFRTETALHDIAQYTTAQVAKHVPYRTHPVLLEFRSLCHQLLCLASEATRAATWFLTRCGNTLPGARSALGHPLNSEDLQRYDMMSTACQRASECISLFQSRLDHIGQCLTVELGGRRSVYMAVLRFLQHMSFNALGGRAALIANLPAIIHTIKLNMREIVDLLSELKTRVTHFHSAFSNLWWLQHEPGSRRQSYSEAFRTVLRSGNAHSSGIQCYLIRLGDGGGIIELHRQYSTARRQGWTW